MLPLSDTIQTWIWLNCSLFPCWPYILLRLKALMRRRQWHPTPVLLPGKSHGWRSLVGCSPWGREVGHDWATSLSLSCVGEGNGNPLQRSCLENPRDGGAWCAAVYGFAQSRTRLKQLSSTSHLPIGGFSRKRRSKSCIYCNKVELQETLCYSNQPLGFVSNRKVS